tara:strand:+ start:1503 stop:2450 length:948 start_codon:yes stop_codon:yes gene_type:complete
MKTIIKKTHQFLKKLISLILPYLKYFRLQSFIIDKLTTIRLKSHYNQQFDNLISKLALKEKLILLDVGAQDFDFENLFPNKFKSYFEPVLVEPNSQESKKLKDRNFKVIENGLWSSETIRNLYITGKNPGGSSMYKPSKDGFDLFNPYDNYFDQYEITNEIKVKCITISESLKNLKIKELDYLKIHAQGAEFEILKGLGNYKPLMLNIEVQIFPQYHEVPLWTEMLDWLYKKGYMICSWEKIGSSMAQSPVQMNMKLIPNFSNPLGKEIINNSKDKFIFLMIATGQISLLKILAKKLNFQKLNDDINKIKDYYFY